MTPAPNAERDRRMKGTSPMARCRLILVLAAGACLAGCYTEHTINAAGHMPIPLAQPAALQSYVTPNPDYPSVGGDVLKGTSPEEQAAARAAADRSLQNGH